MFEKHQTNTFIFLLITHWRFIFKTKISLRYVIFHWLVKIFKYECIRLTNESNDVWRYKLSTIAFKTRLFFSVIFNILTSMDRVSNHKILSYNSNWIIKSCLFLKQFFSTILIFVMRTISLFFDSIKYRLNFYTILAKDLFGKKNHWHKWALIELNRSIYNICHGCKPDMCIFT